MSKITVVNVNNSEFGTVITLEFNGADYSLYEYRGELRVTKGCDCEMCAE